MPRYNRTGEFLFRDGIQVAHFEDWQVADQVVAELNASAEIIEKQAAELRRLWPFTHYAGWSCPGTTWTDEQKKSCLSG